jgi:hypothetical protein
MIKFNKCKLNPEILDQWILADVNVLLVGEKGVGKSLQVIDSFKRNNLKFAYFSGATLDPWIHLLGIPKAKLMPDGTEKMEFILPENLDNDVEAIFVDELNRTNKIVRNALLELQQFKSINGRKFPKLRMVWGAVNPPKNEEDADSVDYDVDELDPAQLDRFHVIIELPNEPDTKYFRSKFGNYHGKILVDWWHEQPKDALKILSPRRLDYVGECFRKGLDIKYLLPISANAKELVKKLALDESQELINVLLANPNDADMQVFLEDDKNALKYKTTLKDEKYWRYWKFIKKEFVTEEIKHNEKFENFAIYQVLKKEPFYREIIGEISKSNPSSTTIKILKSLINQKYVPDATESLSDFVPSSHNFVMLKPTGSITDTFSSTNAAWYVTSNISYDPSNSIYACNTQERRRILSIIPGTWDVIKNKYHLINFVVNCLMSMQKATISNEKIFLSIFGTTCMLAKKTLSKDELIRMILDINANKGKLSNNRVEDFTNYLGSTKETISVVPDSFLKKIKDIRSVISMSSSDLDISDLL